MEHPAYMGTAKRYAPVQLHFNYAYVLFTINHVRNKTKKRKKRGSFECLVYSLVKTVSTSRLISSLLPQNIHREGVKRLCKILWKDSGTSLRTLTSTLFVSLLGSCHAFVSFSGQKTSTENHLFALVAVKFLNDNIVGTVIVVSIIVWVPGSCLISYVVRLLGNPWLVFVGPRLLLFSLRCNLFFCFFLYSRITGAGPNMRSQRRPVGSEM